MLRCALIAATLTVCVASAAAQVQRNFPATALRGELVITAPPEILLNKRPARLAPGARIRGADNMLVMSGAAVNQRMLVHYTLDLQGQLLNVWVLTPNEAARRPWPATPQEAATWSFNPDAQTWSRP
ncbi:MAG: hypothetical protein Q8M96_09015 [Rubrivivax sp.]|nr:hypothetical protein [Rubrivivax sp.]